MKTEFIQSGNLWIGKVGGDTVVTVRTPAGCTDYFEPIGTNAFRWTRVSEKPTDNMTLRLEMAYKLRYFMVPSVNYNGNGWGSGAQYGGFRAPNGEPWKYAWHRVAIPACTYSESNQYAVALFGDEKGGMSCSIYDGENDTTVQELIWPEIEAPKVLYKRCWEPPFYGTMEPQTEFSGVVMLMPAGEERARVRDLLDFALDYFKRDFKMPYTPERVRQLDTLYFRTLYCHTIEGLSGFSCGFHWSEIEQSFVHEMLYEIGWVGQNASVACQLLARYIENGDENLRDKALDVLDSWDREAFLDNGLMLVKLMVPPNHLDSVINGDIPVDLDTCNLGTAATYFFRAADLCRKAGIERPSYEKRAFGLCDFAVEHQIPNGELAKSYFLDGTVNVLHGTVGCFLVLPLFDAYERTGDKKYLDAAIKGLDFYLADFVKTGSTTAGALDSNCIDKESGAPMIRGALRAYDITGDKKYLKIAEDLGYYLATWQWHYSTQFPEWSLCAKAKFDTYGCTAVSAAHNALDFYGIYWVPEYLRLYELTGNEMWKTRARALWYNGQMLLSDGTFVINNRVRPAGSQDESIRHTRWARPDHRIFVTSEWLTSWQGTFREVALDKVADWDLLR